MDMSKRLARLDSHVSAGTVLRSDWGDGRETACLLTALSPEVAERKSPDACPADVMSETLAHLTPWLRDSTTAEHSDEVIVPRFAALAHRWHVLDSDGWRRFDRRVKRAALVEATRCIPRNEACRRSMALLDRSINGDEPSADEWSISAEPAELFALRFDFTVEEVAGWAAMQAPDAARMAVELAVVDSDRLADAILDALEMEISSAEREN